MHAPDIVATTSRRFYLFTYLSSCEPSPSPACDTRLGPTRLLATAGGLFTEQGSRQRGRWTLQPACATPAELCGPARAAGTRAGSFLVLTKVPCSLAAGTLLRLCAPSALPPPLPPRRGPRGDPLVCASPQWPVAWEHWPDSSSLPERPTRALPFPRKADWGQKTKMTHCSTSALLLPRAQRRKRAQAAKPRLSEEKACEKGQP